MPSPVAMVDKWEPRELSLLMRAQSLDIAIVNQVALGLADITWHGGGETTTAERKTVEQVITESGGRLDTQLTKYIQAVVDGKAHRVMLISEGLCTPAPNGSCQIWKLHGNIWRPFKTFKKPYTAYRAYLRSLWRLGIDIVEPPTLEATAQAIAAYVFNDRKPEHTTLRRHIRVQAASTVDDVFVETLMGIKKARIGEATGIKMMAQFKTPFAAMVADFDDMANCIGFVPATRFFKGIGREL